MSLLLFGMRLVGWLLFCVFLSCCFWGLVGLVGMLLEPPRGGRR